MLRREKVIQRVMHHLRRELKDDGLDLREAVRIAVERGWVALPPPIDPFDQLAKEFARVARAEYRKDKTTGRSYRANLAITEGTGDERTTKWFDIDTAKRQYVEKALFQRREQMISDGYHLSVDADHWNSDHPAEDPIQIPFDFTDDIEWRKNAPREEKDAV